MDWKELLVGEESFIFLPEVILRTLIMFFFLVITLRFTGKRGIKQLSIFEMVMIIGLGSAAGDPMFYKSVGILTAILVFALILLSYRIIVFIIVRSERFEKFFEGKAQYIVKNGESTSTSVNNQEFAADEFFAQLRAKNINHLGQVKSALLETTGEVNVLFFNDEEVLPGLPIWPEFYEIKHHRIVEYGTYSCDHCGKTEKIKPVERKICPKCKNDRWVKAMACTRTK